MLPHLILTWGGNRDARVGPVFRDDEGFPDFGQEMTD